MQLQEMIQRLLAQGCAENPPKALLVIAPSRACSAGFPG